MTDQTRQLAEYAARFGYADIPGDVLQRAKDTIADVTGAIVFGSRLPWSTIVTDYVEAIGSTGRSRILKPGGLLVHAAGAALANGLFAHAFEMDGAVRPGAGVHPAGTVFPAALAVAQERGSSGRDVLTAFVAATEVMIRIGRATKKSNERRGFHAPGTTGPFGASIAAGRLLGLDARQMSNAIGIAASTASGLIQFSRAGNGGMVKRLHFGRANESGVVAANLARRGFTGPDDVIEGGFGFLRVFCDEWDEEELVHGLGEAFLTRSIYMKPFPCHGSAQVALQAIEELRAEHGFASSEVSAIEIRGDPEMLERHDIREPSEIMLAQYSVPFCVALAFVRDPRDPRSFDESALTDRSIRSFCERVRLAPLDKAEHRTKDSCTVTLDLADGRQVSRHLDEFRGSPSSPAGPADVREKFSILMRDCGAAKAQELFQRIQALEDEPGLDWLKV